MTGGGGTTASALAGRIRLRAVTAGAGVLALLGLLSSGADPAHASKGKCAGAKVTIQGTKGDDVLEGTQGDDVIRAGRGADEIHAGDGRDIVCAGRGGDIVEGEPGPDLMQGGSGNDDLSGAEGADVLRGGGGFDSGSGGPDTDECLIDSHTECEAELSIVLGQHPFADAGEEIWPLAAVTNRGPSTTIGATVEMTVPEGSELIPEFSHPTCRMYGTSLVACGIGAIGPIGSYHETRVPVAVRLSECESGSELLTATVYDPMTIDIDPAHNTATAELEISPSPDCT